MAVIRGLTQLHRQLAKIPDNLEGQQAAAALVKGAEVLRDGMSRRAPRETGKLAGEILVDLTIRRGRILTRIGPSKATFYGRFQEYGTSRHAAQPFMRPTLDQDGPAAKQLVAAQMGQVVTFATKR